MPTHSHRPAFALQAPSVHGIDDLALDLIDASLDRGARRIEIRTEGRCITVADDTADRLEPSGRVCALAERMTIERHRGGRRLSRSFSRGNPLGPERDHGASSLARTRISLMAEAAIFGDARFSHPALRRELETACALHPWLVAELDGERFEQPRGLAGAVAEMAGSRPLVPYPLRIAGNRSGIQVDLAVQWRRAGQPEIGCYINRRPGSTEGFRAGLLEAAWRSEISEAVIAELLEPGLVAMIAVKGSAGRSVDVAVREVTREGLLAHRRVIDRVIAIRSRSSLLG